MEILTVVKLFAFVFVLAFMIEALVEAIFGQPLNMIPAIKPYKATLLMYIAFGVGITGAFVYKLDLLYTFGYFSGMTIQPHAFGLVLTGLTVGRGSNFVHQLFKKFLSANPIRAVTPPDTYDDRYDEVIRGQVH